MSNISTGGLEVKDDLKSSECTTDDEDEFLDAVTEPVYEEVEVSCPPAHRRTVSSDSTGSAEAETDYSTDQDDPNIRTFVKKKESKRMNSVGQNSQSSPVKKVVGGNLLLNRINDFPPGVGQTEENQNTGQTRHLLQPLEHHEELYREGPLQDPNPGQLLRTFELPPETVRGLRVQRDPGPGRRN